MHLLSPFTFLWLVPLAGIIVALWMLRLKRENYTVPSLFLWRKMLKETQANTPFQKLRRNLLLILQLLAAFFLIFTLTKPYVYGNGLTGRTIIIILDNSASMKAADISPSRLDNAKDKAIDFVNENVHPGDVATIISASNKPAVKLRFTSDRDRIVAAINDISATDTVANMPAAASLAQSLIGTGANAIIRIYSDGMYDVSDSRKLEQIGFGEASVKFVPIGMADAGNLAITALDGRRNPVNGQYEVFVKVQKFGNTQITGTITLYCNNRLVAARSLAINNNEQTETYTGPALANGGLITAKLEGIHDSLEVDNTASIVLNPTHKRKVLLVSAGNIFLENGLNLDPDVVLEEVAPSDYNTLGKKGNGYNLVVFDSYLPNNALPSGNYLVINANNEQTALGKITGYIENPALIDQNRAHPVMRFVDLQGLSLLRSSDGRLAFWAETLADSDNGPIIAAGEHNGIRMISVGFALSDSDWPLRISFPVFLTNAINWLTAGNNIGTNSADTPTGGVATFTVPSGLINVNVIDPSGNKNVVAVPRDGGVVNYSDTELAGIYQIKGNGYSQAFSVNLLNPTESNLNVTGHNNIDRVGRVSSKPSVDVNKKVRNVIWPIIASVALAILTLEWLIYHRRII